MKYEDIKDFSQRCEEHPDHQTGMVSHGMIQQRLQEEVDELRVYIEQALAQGKSNEVVGWCRAYYSFRQERTLYSLYNDQQECINDTAEEGGIVYPLYIQGKM